MNAAKLTVIAPAAPPLPSLLWWIRCHDDPVEYRDHPLAARRAWFRAAQVTLLIFLDIDILIIAHGISFIHQ
jgi:hypothetical protein